LKKIEDLGATLEAHLILDNRYTEHSTVGLAQQWDQLDQLGMRMQHNLEQQIQARNQSGVSEDALKEFSMMFKHFDKDKSGRLSHYEFKSCLRALGYDLPMVEEGEPDPEFEAILGEFTVDTTVAVTKLRDAFIENFRVLFCRRRRSKSGWIRVVARIHGIYDQQGNGQCRKLRRNRERVQSDYRFGSTLRNQRRIIRSKRAIRHYFFFIFSQEYIYINNFFLSARRILQRRWPTIAWPE
jgi:hypothetical protein